jgi:hypothetical protein
MNAAEQWACLDKDTDESEVEQAEVWTRSRPIGSGAG